MLACCVWTIERSLALAAIETREVAAGERRPNDTIARDIQSAWRESLNRRFRIVPRQLVHFSERGLGGIRSGSDSDDRTGETEDRSPNGAIGRTHSHAIERTRDPLVLRRIDRLIRLDVCVAFTVAVGIQNESRPSLRLLFIAGFIEHLHVQPTDDVTATAARRPERVVRVLCELQVVCAVTGVDERDLLRLGIINCELPSR